MINRIAGVSLKGCPEPGKKVSGAAFDFKDVAKFIEPVETLIANNPGAAIAAAFCVGVALAWWIKRSK